MYIDRLKTVLIEDETILMCGKPEVRLLQDGWTAVTRDRTLSAQYEHMIGVLPDGIEIFTLSGHSAMKSR